MSNLKAQGTRAFFWDFFGKIARQGTGFIVSIFLARLLEPSDFGLIAIITVMIGVANVFTDVGLSSALIQRKRLLPVHYSSVFYFNLFAGLTLTSITYLSADWLGHFYNNDKLIPITQVLSLSFVINAFSSVHSSKLRKELNYALITKTTFFSSVISGILGVSLAFNHAGVWSLVAQALSVGIFFNIFIWIFSKWRPKLEFSWKALSQLWGFGFKMFLSAIIAATIERLDFLIIGKILPIVTLGYFERAKTLNNTLVQYSSGSLMAVLFPILSTLKTNLPRFQGIVIKAMGIISFVVFLLIGALYIASEEIIVLLLSEKWLPSVAFFKIFVLSGFAYPISALLVNVLSSRGNSSAFLRLEIYKTIVIAANFIALYLWGLEIYLYGILITSFCCVLLNILFVSREINLSFFTFFKPLIIQMSISIVAILFVVFFQNFVSEYDVSSIIEFPLFTELMVKIPPFADFMTKIDVFTQLITKIFLYTISYIFINASFKTKQYFYFKSEILLVIKNRGRK